MIISYLLLWQAALLKLFSNKNVVGSIIIFFAVFLAFYDSSGTDWDTYRKIFYSNDDLYFEPGFRVLFRLTRITGSFSLLLIICIFLFISSIISFLNKYFYIPIWLVVLGITSIYVPLFSGAIRQALAMSFIVLAYSKKDNRIYCLLIASLFHFSSAIFFLVLLLEKINLNLFLKIIATVFCGTIVLFILKYDQTLYNLFKSGDSYIKEGTVGGLKDIAIIIERILFIILALFAGKISSCNSLKSLIYPSIVGSILFILFFSEFRNFAGRTLSVLRVFDLIIMFIGLKYFFKRVKQRNILTTIIVLSYSLVKFLVTSNFK
jgi:hypothetical protein